jgi:hypothetical protein
MLKLSRFDRYAKMSGKQFEEEAKHASPMGGVMLVVQKRLDPSHRVEYLQQTEARREDRTNSDDKPSR